MNVSSDFEVPIRRSADVLLLPAWYLPIGGEFCREQAWHLNRNSIRADILATISLPWRKHPFKLLTDSWRDKQTNDDGIFIYSRFHRPIPMCDEPNIKRWSQAVVDLFERYVSCEGMPRLIHAHSSTWAGYAASLIKEKYGIPYIITEHRGIFGMRSQLAVRSFKSFYAPYLQKAFDNSSRIIAVSGQLLPKIESFLSHEVPMEVLSNIVDTNFFLPKKRNHEKLKFRFIAVNGYWDVKGYDVLVPAFDSLCDRFSQVELVLVGPNFNHPEFQRLLRKCRHQDAIHFTGTLSSMGVRNELYSADALVISSRVEAQSISVLEALSTGIPVVCTDPIPEYVVGEGQGIRVPVEDVEALTEAMFQMVLTVNDYNPYKLFEHVKSIASPGHVVNRLKEIYSCFL